MIALSPTHRKVLLAIGVDKRTYVTLHETASYPALWETCRLPERAVRTTIDKLVIHGLLEQHPTNKNRYQLTEKGRGWVYDAF